MWYAFLRFWKGGGEGERSSGRDEASNSKSFHDLSNESDPIDYVTFSFSALTSTRLMVTVCLSKSELIDLNNLIDDICSKTRPGRISLHKSQPTLKLKPLMRVCIVV
jgi:hypothetical protein